jgi:hypothetical protein
MKKMYVSTVLKESKDTSSARKTWCVTTTGARGESLWSLSAVWQYMAITPNSLDKVREPVVVLRARLACRNIPSF